MLKKFLGFFGYFLLVLLFVAAINIYPAAAQVTIVSQPPDLTSAIFSDPDCDFCGGSQVAADNFVLTITRTIGQIRTWGIWSPDVALPPDNFTVIFHNDAAGIPGANAAPMETGVPVTRLATGNTVAGSTEYEFVLTLANPVTLSPGTYWVEIFNDTTGSTESYAWEFGILDVVNGAVNSAGDTVNVPGSVWFNTGFDAFAMEIITAAPAVPAPTMNQWGMIIFMLLAGFGSIYFLREKRIES